MSTGYIIPEEDLKNKFLTQLLTVGCFSNCQFRDFLDSLQNLLRDLAFSERDKQIFFSGIFCALSWVEGVNKQWYSIR